MEKLIKHLSKRHMSCVQRHNQSNHEGRKKQIASNFELVEFILGAFPENMRTMRYQTLKQEETSLLYMELLCAIFSCFEGYEASELGVAAIGKDGAVLPVVGHVEGVCRSLYTLMKSLKDSNTSEDGDVIRMGFQLWWSLFHFNIIGGPVDTVLNDSTSYSVVNEIRMRKLFENDASVQRMFGNISVAYQSKMRRDNANAIVRQLDEQKAELEEKRVKEVNLLRAELQKGAVELENVRMESERHAVARTELEEKLKKAADTIALCQNEKAQADNNWNRELEREKMRVCELTNRLEVLNRCPTEGSPGSYRASENGHSSAVSSTLQKRRSEANVQVSSSSVPLLCQDFWSQDIYDVFQSRPTLCSKVASYFEKVKGARDGSWEHLMEKLKIDLDKKELETLPVKNILLAILCQWKRGCQATVRLFCEVSEAMGNSQVTAHMKMAAQQCARSVGQGDEDSRAFGTTLTNGSEKMSWQTVKSQSPGDEGESYQDVRSQRSIAEAPRRRSGQVTPDCYCESEDFEDKTAVTRTSILQDKATSIAQYMNPTEISPHLFQKRLLTQSQLDHLHSLPETKAKNTYIIHKVGSLGRKAVSLFVECLRATAYEVPAHEDLANELEPLLQRFCH